MVQIYCPNCKHQLWSVQRGEHRAPRQGEDTHPHVPSGQMPPRPLTSPCCCPQAPGAESQPPVSGVAPRATGPWAGQGCAGCRSLSIPTGLVFDFRESPCPHCHTALGTMGPCRASGVSGLPKGAAEPRDTGFTS